MSALAFVWALEQGRRLSLSVSERMLLIALADRANGDGYCYPGQDTLAGDTGLSERSIRDVALSLQRHELVSIERRGRLLYYHIVGPNAACPKEPQHRQPLPVSPAETPATTAAIEPTPATTAAITPAAIAAVPDDTGNSASAIPAAIAAKPKKENQVSKKESPCGPHAVGTPTPPGRRADGTNPRAEHNNPRAKGTSPRQASANPRVLGTNPRNAKPLPEAWTPTEHSIALGIDLGLTAAEVLAEADAMRDWARHRGETGKDWDSRFNNWIRKEAKDRYLRRVRTNKPTLAEEWGLKSFLTPVFDDDDEPSNDRRLQ